MGASEGFSGGLGILDWADRLSGISAASGRVEILAWSGFFVHL